LRSSERHGCFSPAYYPEEHIENMIWDIKLEIGRNILKDSGSGLQRLSAA
jgi:hypothetical protein